MNSNQTFISFADSPEFITLALLSCFSGIMTIGGNAVVLIAIFRTKTLHSISNFYIASLAAADLLVGAILNPILAVKGVLIYLHPDPQWLKAGSVFDKIEDFAWIQAVVASTFGLTAISVDRYIAVNFGLRYEQLSSLKHCIIAIATVWVSSLIFASVRLFLDKLEHLSILWVVMAIITCILPFVIITFCYVNIFRAARQQVRRILNETSLPSNAQNAWRRSKRLQISHQKTALTIGIVVFLFILLWMPSLVTSMIQLILSSSQNAKDKETLLIIERKIWLLVCLVAYVSSACNPWVYSIRCRQFRVACKRTFKCFNSPRASNRVETIHLEWGTCEKWVGHQRILLHVCFEPFTSLKRCFHAARE